MLAINFLAYIEQLFIHNNYQMNDYWLLNELSLTPSDAFLLGVGWKLATLKGNLISRSSWNLQGSQAPHCDSNSK